MRFSIFFIAFISSFSSSLGQLFSPEELELYNLIMEYRASKSLPVIPPSPSLTLVARVHVHDLHENRPDTGKCNLHSWSDKGQWSAVCYTKDHALSAGMWCKPAELTNYKGSGYEISYKVWGYPGIVVSPLQAFKGWKSSPGHNNVIINKEKWAKLTWRAIGISIYMGYAVVWFGEEPDDLIFTLK